jgi:beta-galactosidase
MHVDLLDYAGPGVYAHATQISAERADIAVLARLRNDSAKAGKVSVVTRILDADGREVGKTTERVRIAAKSNAEVKANLTVPNPRLWNGRADPYLYSVTVELDSGASTIDSVAEPLGIRSFRVDANAGLFLNGKHLPLYGVSRHQDRAGKGWALSKADHEEDMALIAEVGANAVRFAHYQHAPEWFELSDRYGMLVWSEIPFVNETNFTPDEPTPALVGNARQQLIEAIRQNYNHPSVFTWSVGNEIDIGGRMRYGKAGKSLGLLRTLNELAKQEDPSRLTTFADCCENPPVTLTAAEPLAGTTDLIGYNRYFGWYYGKPAGFGAAMDTFHERHPQLPMSVSEYGAGAALTQHTDNPLGGVINMLGRPHPEEIQNWYHEQSWPQIQSRAFIWGSFIWNMFDFSSDLREEGDSVDINNKGLVSYDRKTKKDAFFYYQAQWSKEPVVHINSARYIDRAYPMTDVRVYSNAPSVRLKRNDTDLGAATCEDRVCVWRDVALNAGANTFTASAEFSGKTVGDSVNWNGPDPTQGIRIDSGDLVGHRAADGVLIGSDNFFTGGDARLLNGLSGGGFSPGARPERKIVAGAKDAALYDGYRVGSFSYDIPLPSGEWNVTVHAFEPIERLVDSRTFDVIANGRVQLKAWSPGKAAGGVFKAAEATFKVRAQGGRLQLQFEPGGGPALVAAIVITPVTKPARK